MSSMRIRILSFYMPAALVDLRPVVTRVLETLLKCNFQDTRDHVLFSDAGKRAQVKARCSS